VVRRAAIRLVVLLFLPASALARGSACHYTGGCGSLVYLALWLGPFAGIYFLLWGKRPAKQSPRWGSLFLWFFVSNAVALMAFAAATHVANTSVLFGQILAAIVCYGTFSWLIRPPSSRRADA
jgi:hypothetical protein